MTTAPPDRVTVWQSQLAANDFPPVCVMCGAPAETWRKFNFATAPPWAFLLGVIVAMALSRRASGYLPMTRACVQKLRLVRWIFGATLLAALALWILAFAIGVSAGSDPTWSGVTVLLILLGIVALSVGFIGLVLVRSLYGPTGKVMEQQYGQYEPVIELQRVNPNFAAAVRQMQQARAAQYAAGAQLPLQPGSR